MNRILLGVALVSAASVGLPAQNVGSVHGVVRRDSSGTPIAEAQVSIPTLARNVMTDASGAYRLDVLPPGQHILVIRKIGFLRYTDTVTVKERSTTIRNVSLAIDVQNLDSVRVEAKADWLPAYMRGFEERRKTGHGRYIDEAEMRKNDNRKLPDVLQKLPGLEVIRLGSFSFIASTRGPASFERSRPTGEGWPRSLPAGCYPAVWLDNVRIYAPGTNTPVPDMARFQVSAFAAIEYYAGGATTPQQFAAFGSACGTIVLWSRFR